MKIKIALILIVVLTVFKAVSFADEECGTVCPEAGAFSDKELSTQPTVSQKESKVLHEVATFSESNVDDAILYLEKELSDESSAALDFILGNLYFQKENLEKASELYRSAICKMPSFMKARGNLARILIQQNKINEAIDEFKSIMETGDPLPSTFTLIGYTYLLSNQPVPAETAYRQAIMREPNDKNAYLGLIKSLFLQERYAEAKKLIIDMLNRYPEHKNLWSLLANANLAFGKAEDALVNLECARRIGAASPEALATLGDIYQNMNMIDAAIGAYKESFEMKKASVKRMLRASEGFLMMNEPDTAEMFLSMVSDVEKEKTLCASDKMKKLLLSARVAQLRDDYKTARETYEKLLDEDPLDSDALMFLGDIYRKEDNPEKALLYYERAARVAENRIDPLLRQAQLLVDLGKYKPALEVIEEAQKIKAQPHVARYAAQVRQLASVSSQD